MGMQGRWARELSEREIRKVLNARKLRVAESDIMGIQFFSNISMLSIVRASGVGGDVFTVHGGWKYGNLIAYLQDWKEIEYISDRVSVWEKHQGERVVKWTGQ